MEIHFKGKTSKQSVNNLAKKISIALFIGIIIGVFLLYLREYLISNNNEHIWSVINNLFF